MNFFSRKLWERKYVDLWAVTHFLVFALFGFAPYFSKEFLGVDMSFYTALTVTILVNIIWEGFEYVLDVGEATENILSDIIVGILGFCVMYWLLPHIAGNSSTALTIFGFILLGSIVMSVLGWVSYSRYKGML